MGHGTIYTFEHPENLTGFDFEHKVGWNIQSIQFLWTPYQDELEESVFRNIHDGQVFKNLDWGGSEPNGGRSENHVGLLLHTSKLHDLEETRDYDTGQRCNNDFFANSLCYQTFFATVEP